MTNFYIKLCWPKTFWRKQLPNCQHNFDFICVGGTSQQFEMNVFRITSLHCAVWFTRAKVWKLNQKQWSCLQCDIVGNGHRCSSRKAADEELLQCFYPIATLELVTWRRTSITVIGFVFRNVSSQLHFLWQPPWRQTPMVSSNVLVSILTTLPVFSSVEISHFWTHCHQFTFSNVYSTLRMKKVSWRSFTDRTLFRLVMPELGCRSKCNNL